MTTNITLEAYRDVTPAGTVDLLHRMAEMLKGKSLLHVNSTRWGGGVAEMLHRLVPLFQDAGIDTRWDVIEGSPEFYNVTKSFHNALQGTHQDITEEMLEEYKRINRMNAEKLNLNADVVIIHDPQPAALISERKAGQSWIWRCHIDASRPQRRVWTFLRDYVAQYDGAIFSLPDFAQKLPIPQTLIYPSIDPLSDKNKELSDEQIRETMEKFNIPTDKPMILQVSRFDRFKDPLGVIQAYKMIKACNDCTLVLAGGSAADDPEGQQVLAEVHAAAGDDPDIFILDLPADANIDINALQRGAAIVLQKSLKEGFGLTVAEAMWKGRPVIGGFVGGIASQIIYGITGYTVHSIEGCAYQMRYLLNNPDVAKRIGENAREYTRRNFLITRHVRDYMALMITSMNKR